MKVLIEQLNPTVGDLEGNAQKVINGLKKAQKWGADLVVFSELVLTGYPPEDLLLDRALIDAAFKKLGEIAPWTKGLFAAVGLPRWTGERSEKFLYNSAAIFADGKLLGFQNKVLLPTYDVFDERRFFEPGAPDQPVWVYRGKRIGVTICEDLWEHANAVGYTHYRSDPVLSLRDQKPDLVLNLSASPYSFEKKELRFSVVQKAAQTVQCPVILCNQVGGNDQLVFDGGSIAVNEKGEWIARGKEFVEDALFLDLGKQSPPFMIQQDPICDLYHALVLGVRDYFQKQGFEKAILGISGGIDSAVTACIAADALGSSQVLGLSMPSRYSSVGSKEDAKELSIRLGIELKSIDIDPLFQSYLTLLDPFFEQGCHTLTRENLQARIRGMLLMAFSNQEGAIVLATGNKSEMAMGYTTLYGDMVGGLGVLQDVMKLRVYALARYINREKEIIPISILKKAPSAELKFGQKTEEELHSFERLDPIIEGYIEGNGSGDRESEVIHSIHLAEYKRRQAPIGIRVSSKAFSKGRIVPIVQKWLFGLII